MPVEERSQLEHRRHVLRNPAKPSGCLGATLAIVIVLLAIGLFVAGVWWMLRDVGAI